MLESAKAARLLSACRSVTWLECKSAFWPAHLGKQLRRLSLHGSDNSRLQGVVAELPSCPRLTRLSIRAPGVSLPAAFATVLPPSLRHVAVSLHLEDDDSEIGAEPEEGDVPILDLGAFAADVGCSAGLALSINAKDITDPDASSVQALLPRLSAVPAPHSLQVHASEACVADICQALAAVSCGSCQLNIHQTNPALQDPIPDEPQELVCVSSLPSCGRVDITFTDTAKRPVQLAWAALTSSPGIHCIGSKRVPLAKAVTVQDYTGLPAIDEPWALVVWDGGLQHLSGLPFCNFAQEGSNECKFVWRNAAAAGLEL